MATKKKTVVKTTGKKAAQEKSEAPAFRISNSRIVYIGVAVILLLSALQFLLILTLGDNSLKPLAKDRVHQIVVNRVIDLRFPSLEEPQFRRYLSRLSNRIARKIGFRVSFLIKKTVLADNYISGKDAVFNSSAARDWFKKNAAGEPCRFSTRLDWLDALLRDSNKRALFVARYKTADGAALIQNIRRDFLKRAAFHRGIKDRSGRPLGGGDSCFRAAAACWAYLLSGQVNSDFIVSNSPVFFPSAVTPADAVSRGGMVYSMIAQSGRALQGVLFVSLYPVHRLRSGKRIRDAVRLSLQGFARLLLRRPFELRDRRSLLYPIFGDQLKKWVGKERGIVFDNAPVLKRF